MSTGEVGIFLFLMLFLAKLYDLEHIRQRPPADLFVPLFLLMILIPLTGRAISAMWSAWGAVLTESGSRL